MQTLIPAEKRVMEPIVLPNLEVLGIVNHFLILFGFSHCNHFDGARKMKVLCIDTSKKWFLHGAAHCFDFKQDNSVTVNEINYNVQVDD